ncbi:MAG: hypothetical protein RBS10_01475 [Thauera propionica]|jgi:hypothetical protein|nr:hypothetical protein [Thauera propionica]
MHKTPSVGRGLHNAPFVLRRLVFGDGRLAGDFPDGITKKEGVPHPAEVRVMLRTSAVEFDGALVKTVRSAADGTWEVTGLNPALKYDVVSRLAGYNDLILSQVRPQSPTYTPPVDPTPETPGALAIRGIMDGLTQLEDGATVRVSGGVPPYTLQVIGGSLPPSSYGEQIFAFENGLFIIAYDAPVASGIYSWTLRATDSESNTVELSESVTQA